MQHTKPSIPNEIGYSLPKVVTASLSWLVLKVVAQFSDCHNVNHMHFQIQDVPTAL